MTWKGVKCKGCGRDIGCPAYGQILPSMREVSCVIDGKEEHFCTSQCRDKFLETKK